MTLHFDVNFCRVIDRWLGTQYRNWMFGILYTYHDDREVTFSLRQLAFATTSKTITCTTWRSPSFDVTIVFGTLTSPWRCSRRLALGTAWGWADCWPVAGTTVRLASSAAARQVSWRPSWLYSAATLSRSGPSRQFCRPSRCPVTQPNCFLGAYENILDGGIQQASTKKHRKHLLFSEDGKKNFSDFRTF